MNSENQQFLTMALVYLEIGRVASSANTELINLGDYQNGVAYQMYHAIELFYKYMIKQAKGNVPYTHDLSNLEENYSRLYPGDKLKLAHPFDFRGMQELKKSEKKAGLERHLNKFKPNFLDQHLRYPADEKTGGYCFKLETEMFEKMKLDMLKISEVRCY